LRIKLSCAGWAALDSTLPSTLNRRLVFIVYLLILDLTGGDIDDQLPELDRVARAFETLRCHAGKYGMLRDIRKPSVKGSRRVTASK
jgi:hypothetical protein